MRHARQRPEHCKPRLQCTPLSLEQDRCRRNTAHRRMSRPDTRQSRPERSLVPSLLGSGNRGARCAPRLTACEAPRAVPRFDRERVSISKRDGNESYCTNALMLPIQMMLCGKLHCQKVSVCTILALAFRQLGCPMCATLDSVRSTASRACILQENSKLYGNEVLHECFTITNKEGDVW